MITRNWYNALKASFTNMAINDGLTLLGGGKNKLSPTTGGSLSNLMVAFSAAYWATGNSSSGVTLGSGSTPATVDDYKLESAITKGLSVSITRIYENPVKLVILITNTSDAPITIAEVGWQSLFGGAYALADRTVLDTPVTIPAGGIGKIEYEIKINLPIDEA